MPIYQQQHQRQQQQQPQQLALRRPLRPFCWSSPHARCKARAAPRPPFWSGARKRQERQARASIRLSSCCATTFSPFPLSASLRSRLFLICSRCLAIMQPYPIGPQGVSLFSHWRTAVTHTHQRGFTVAPPASGPAALRNIDGEKDRPKLPLLDSAVAHNGRRRCAHHERHQYCGPWTLIPHTCCNSAHTQQDRSRGASG